MTQQADGYEISTEEFGYYLLAELITMPDRELAAKIELDIWANSAQPRRSRLKVYCQALMDSEDDSDFMEKAREIASNSGLIFNTTVTNGRINVSANVPSATAVLEKDFSEKLTMGVFDKGELANFAAAQVATEAVFMKSDDGAFKQLKKHPDATKIEQRIDQLRFAQELINLEIKRLKLQEEN